MNTITINDLKGYFGTDLHFLTRKKLQYPTANKDYRESVKIMTPKNIDSLIDNSRYIFSKPLLWPLDFLTKDEGFDLYMDLCETIEVVRCDALIEALQGSRYYALDIQKYKLLEEWMYKNHFDWKYNLISRGLALSKENFIRDK